MPLFARKHKLPRFPETVIPTFRRLCEPLAPEMLPRVRADFEECVSQKLRALESNPRLSRVRLEQIIESASLLFGRYESASKEERALIIGALRYFALVDDPLPDETFLSGLDDDAKVFNHVLEALGFETGFIVFD